MAKEENNGLPFNRCQINKTVEYGKNGSTRTSIMFNVRENNSVKAAKLFKRLTDNYYKYNPKRKISSGTSSSEKTPLPGRSLEEGKD